MVSRVGEGQAVETPRHLRHGLGRIVTGEVHRVRLENVQVHRVAFHGVQEHRFVCAHTTRKHYPRDRC